MLFFSVKRQNIRSRHRGALVSPTAIEGYSSGWLARGAATVRQDKNSRRDDDRADARYIDVSNNLDNVGLVTNRA